MSEYHVFLSKSYNFYSLFLMLRQASWESLILEPMLCSQLYFSSNGAQLKCYETILAIYFRGALWILHRMNSF